MWSLILILYFLLCLSFRNLFTKQFEDEAVTTKDNESALEQLRILTSDVLDKDYEKTDDFLFRWIEESDMDVTTANEMIQKTKKWRKDNNVDSILDESIGELERGSNNNCSIDTLDKDGKPVFICTLGKINMRNLLTKPGFREKFIRFYMQWGERYLAKLRSVPNGNQSESNRGLFVANADGFNFRQHACTKCIDLILEGIGLVRANYPRCMRDVILINVPNVALPIASLIKQNLPVYYQNIFRIFGSNKTQWSTYLLNLIPPEQLEVRFGGTKVQNS